MAGGDLVFQLVAVLMVTSLTSVTVRWIDRIGGLPRNALVENITACNDDNNCTRDVYHVADRTCEYRARATSHACKSACHVDDSTGTYCTRSSSGDAICASTDMTECLGYCNDYDNETGMTAVCAERIPIDHDYWIFGGDGLVYNPFDWIVSYGHTCEYNQCGAWVTGFWTYAQDNRPQAAGSVTRDCMDYLNQTQLALMFGTLPVAKTCIVATRTILDNFGSPLAAATFDTPVNSTNVFVCTYQYACSAPTGLKLNYTQILDAVYNDVPVH